MKKMNMKNTIEYKDFIGSVEFSEEDNCWVVVVPELEGCQADGETKEEALANSDIIIQEWLDTAASLGREIPEPAGY